ncbi:MAG: hypothetical protein WBR15_07060 [Gammaproteobacteria bacterium]
MDSANDEPTRAEICLMPAGAIKISEISEIIHIGSYEVGYNLELQLKEPLIDSIWTALLVSWALSGRARIIAKPHWVVPWFKPPWLGSKLAAQDHNRATSSQA